MIQQKGHYLTSPGLHSEESVSPWASQSLNSSRSQSIKRSQTRFSLENLKTS
jgi:hypothetical protein